MSKGPRSDGVDKRCLEHFHLAEEEVLLGREIVEDGSDRDVGGSSDLGHGYRVETPLREEPKRSNSDSCARLLLLALSQSRLGGMPLHGTIS